MVFRYRISPIYSSMCSSYGLAERDIEVRNYFKGQLISFRPGSAEESELTSIEDY